MGSFAGLYDLYAQKIFGFLFHKTFDRSLAEDLASETFMKALERIQGFDPKKGNFQAWLFAIARNTLIDHFRSRKETASIEDAWELAADDDTARSAELSLLRRSLQEKMLLLNPQQREILMLRFWQDLSFRDIAQILGKSEASVKMAAGRGLRSLRGHARLLSLFALLVQPSSNSF